MVMRISSIQAFNNGVTGIGRNYSNVIRTQEQISTGKRILTPADDPVASVRLMQLEQQQAPVLPYPQGGERLYLFCRQHHLFLKYHLLLLQ